MITKVSVEQDFGYETLKKENGGTHFLITDLFQKVQKEATIH